MVERSPIISLCVPTYNRSGLLIEALEAIVLQIVAGNFWEVVELVICDNASTDNTQAVLSSFLEQYPALVVTTHLQDSNLGPDGNIYTALRKATGRWAWVLSDDDILLPGSLEYLIKMLKGFNDSPVVCVNARSFEVSPDEETASFLNNSTESIAGHNGALVHLSTMLTFLSILVVPTASYANTDYSRFIGTQFLHSHIFIDAIKQAGGIHTVSQPLIAVRANNTGGYVFYQTFGTDFASLLGYAKQQGYEGAAVATVMRRHLRKFLFPFTCSFKAHGAVGRLKPDFADGRRRLQQLYACDPFFWAVMLPMLISPGWMVSPLARMRRQLRGSKSGGSKSQ
jgi:glycosyltransferase involved in cell wall biosynthesis